MVAVQSGDASAVDQLLKRGADPNYTDARGATALMWAVPDIEKVRRLVSAGAKINALSTDTGRTPFLIAASYPGTVDVLNFLLAKGADLSAKDAAGFTALGLAMVGADVEVVRLLVEKGLDPNDAGPIVAQRAAYGRHRPAVVEYLMSRGLKVSADSLTANWQQPELIARWIDMGGDVNAKVGPYGGTPLMRSVSSDSLAQTRCGFCWNAAPTRTRRVPRAIGRSTGRSIVAIAPRLPCSRNTARRVAGDRGTIRRSCPPRAAAPIRVRRLLEASRCC